MLSSGTIRSQGSSQGAGLGEDILGASSIAARVTGLATQVGTSSCQGARIGLGRATSASDRSFKSTELGEGFLGRDFPGVILGFGARSRLRFGARGRQGFGARRLLSTGAWCRPGFGTWRLLSHRAWHRLGFGIRGRLGVGPR